MKKLRKLDFSPEKVMKNEELINLKGGYGSYDPYDPYGGGDDGSLGNPCGSPYMSYRCYYNPCAGCPEVGPGIVCRRWGVDPEPCVMLGWQYPGMDGCDCNRI